MVEKNKSGFFIKYLALIAARLFFLARISILILLETINAISDEEKKPLNNKSAMRTNNSLYINIIVNNY